LVWSRDLVVLGVAINDRDDLPESLLGVATTIDGRLLGSKSCSLSHQWDDENRFERLVTAIAALVHQLCDSFVGAHKGVIGLGVSLGGHVENGTIRFSINTGIGSRGGAGDIYFPLQDRLAELLTTPVFVENDVNAIANSILLLGNRMTGIKRAPFPIEADLSDDELDDFVLIAVLDGGVGGGLVVDGRLRRGATGMAGEAGHIPITSGYPTNTSAPEERKCRCGHVNCLEAYCSPAAILQELQCGSLADAVMLPESHAAAAEAFMSAGRALGTAIAGLANGLNPRAFILHLPLELQAASPRNAGGFFDWGMRHAIIDNCFSDTAERTRVAVRFSSQQEQRHRCALASAQLVVERLICGNL